MAIKDLFPKRKPKGKAQALANIGNIDWKFINGQFVMDEDKSSTYIDKGYKELPNLYGIISLIIQKSSIVPHETFKIVNKSKYRKYKAQLASADTMKDYARAMVTKAQALEKVEGTDLDQLLSKPNQYQSIEEFYESIDGYLLMVGNSYMYGMTTGLTDTRPKELHSLIAPSVVIKAGDSWREPVEGYTLNYMTDLIPAEDIGHIKYWNPLSTYSKIEDLLYGLSPLKSCRRLLGKYKEADIAQGSMFKNMGVSGILSGPDDSLDEQTALALRDKWKQLYGGSTKAGDIAITSANVQWHQIGLSPVDLNIIEAKEEILGELCNVYHVPIGMFTKVNSTENNMVESRKMFITDAVIPLVERRKNVINRWLVPKFDDKLIVEYDYTVFSEMNEDLDKLVDAAVKSYWITPNEKRQLTNWDKDDRPEMDDFYFPSGLTKLEDMSMDVEDIDPKIIEDAETN